MLVCFERVATIRCRSVRRTRCSVKENFNDDMDRWGTYKQRSTETTLYTTISETNNKQKRIWKKRKSFRNKRRYQKRILTIPDSTSAQMTHQSSSIESQSSIFHPQTHSD